MLQIAIKRMSGRVRGKGQGNGEAGRLRGRKATSAKSLFHRHRVLQAQASPLSKRPGQFDPIRACLPQPSSA